MKKFWSLCVILMACFVIPGCGSPDREQQKASVHPEVKAQSEDVLEEAKAQREEVVQEIQRVQTEWDGNLEDRQEPEEASADVEVPAPKPEDGDGSKYQVDFLGNDSSNITSCILYHDGKKEALNLSTAKGKYFIQMLSGFFGEYENGYGYFNGGMCLDWLEEVSKEKTENYYIKLQIEDPVAITFKEIDPGVENTRTVEGYDTLIIEAQVHSDIEYLILFWNDGTDAFWGDAPNKVEGVDLPEEFQAKYEAWEKITDWDAAFAELEAEKENP